MTSLADMLQADMSRWVLGLALAGVVAAAGQRSKSLTRSGALSATMIGGLTVGTGGWWTGLLLVVFFVSSSLLSHARPGATSAVAQARGHQRDAVQVVANGGIPVLCAVTGWLMSSPEPWLLAAASAIAGATADTWATEIGRRSSNPPRSIVSWKALSPGTSGAIGALGTSGSVLGALLIAAVAALGSAVGPWIDAPARNIVIVVTIAGIAGSLLDSLLGATLQGIWWCPTCEVITESAIHHCGEPTCLQRGLSFMDNDLVNAVSIAGAGATGLILGTFTF